MARITRFSNNFTESRFSQSCFEIEGVIFIAPGFGALHQGEEDGGEILNYRGLGIVIDDRQTAARSQNPPRFLENFTGRLLGQFMGDKLQTHQIKGLVGKARILRNSMFPGDGVLGIAVLGDAEHIGRKVKARGIEGAIGVALLIKLAQGTGGNPDGATNIENVLDLIRALLAKNIVKAAPQAILGGLPSHCFIQPHPHRHGIGRWFRFKGRQPGQIAIVVGMERDIVVVGVL